MILSTTLVLYKISGINILSILFDPLKNFNSCKNILIWLSYQSKITKSTYHQIYFYKMWDMISFNIHCETQVLQYNFHFKLVWYEIYIFTQYTLQITTQSPYHIISTKSFLVFLSFWIGDSLWKLFNYSNRNQPLLRFCKFSS